MAELHIIGEITYAEDFGDGSFFCVYELSAGTAWAPIEGNTSGCTHIMESDDNVVPWSFPIDTHFGFSNIQGWPKVCVQVWKIDEYGRKDIAGYGMAYLPMPAMREQTVEILTWKPLYWSPSGLQRFYEKMRLLLMGGNPVLRDTALIHRNDDRFKLHTIGSGSVTLKLTLISRGMKKSGMVFK